MTQRPIFSYTTFGLSLREVQTLDFFRKSVVSDSVLLEQTCEGVFLRRTQAKGCFANQTRERPRDRGLLCSASLFFTEDRCALVPLTLSCWSPLGMMSREGTCQRTSGGDLAASCTSLDSGQSCGRTRDVCRSLNGISRTKGTVVGGLHRVLVSHLHLR